VSLIQDLSERNKLKLDRMFQSREKIKEMQNEKEARLKQTLDKKEIKIKAI